MRILFNEPAKKRLWSPDRCKIFVAQQSMDDSKNSMSLLFWDTGPGILESTPRGSLKCLSKQEKTPEEMSPSLGKTDHVTRLVMLRDPPT